MKIEQSGVPSIVEVATIIASAAMALSAKEVVEAIPAPFPQVREAFKIALPPLSGLASVLSNKEIVVVPFTELQ